MAELASNSARILTVSEQHNSLKSFHYRLLQYTGPGYMHDNRLVHRYRKKGYDIQMELLMGKKERKKKEMMKETGKMQYLRPRWVDMTTAATAALDKSQQIGCDRFSNLDY